MTLHYNRLIVLGASLALAGFITSGPLGFIAVNIFHPQPPWTTAAEFANHYHLLQDIPYYFGFFLIAGMLMVICGHYLNYNEENHSQKFRLFLSVLLSGVFCTLISFNYICQTTFIRNLAVHYAPENDTAIAMFSMANPYSFCWANEMWGYAFLGLATWLMAGYYASRNKIIRGLLIANGLFSLGGPIVTTIDVAWVMTPWGIGAYFVWNTLMIILMVMIHRDNSKFHKL